MPLVLASQSPARLATLRAAGIEPEVHVSEVDEDAILAATALTYPIEWGRELLPDDAVLELARAKAEAVAVARGDEDEVILGCDSMLEFDGEILGKPLDPQVAVERWRTMRGRSGVLRTGHWAILSKVTRGPGNHHSVRQSAVGASAATTVHFAHLSDAEIDAYVATGEPLHVAGGFTIDGLGGPFIERIEGDHHAVVGLSLPLLRTLLGELGLSITSFWNRAM